MPPKPETWLRVTPEGLHCAPGGFHIDPVQPVERAVVTHGHSDHARAGHRHVLATPETVAIMRRRYDDDGAATYQALAYGERVQLGGVTLRLAPAGHVLGSAQAVLERSKKL
jgi:putative mRNA 3-end processing factor